MAAFRLRIDRSPRVVKGWMARLFSSLTHLVGAGFMLQAMSGALFQFIPVAVGGNVWRPRLVANVVHPLLVVAALLLVAGLLFSSPAYLTAAIPLFLLGTGGAGASNRRAVT